MLAGATDLLGTARTPVVVINTLDAATYGIADGDLVEVSSEHGSLRLAARVGSDVVPRTVVLPTNSTDEPLGVLAAADGHLRVSLSAVDAEVADLQTVDASSEEVA
jgi:NADH-quinone oxidoreductase subunit G